VNGRPRTYLDAADLFVFFSDLQTSVHGLTLTIAYERLRRSARVLARLANLFELPALATCIPEPGGAAPEVIPEIGATLDHVARFTCTTFNAFDDPGVRAAIEGSGRRTLLLAGVATELAVQWAALTAAAEGYAVYLLLDACGGFDRRSEDAALRRMMVAGCRAFSVPALASELAGAFTQAKEVAAIDVLFTIADP